MSANPCRCAGCGQLDYDHYGDGRGALWCTVDGMEKGYGHYFEPGVPVEAPKPCQVPENAGLYSVEPAIYSPLAYPPPCVHCGRTADAVWLSLRDGDFYLCGECVGAVPGLAP